MISTESYSIKIIFLIWFVCVGYSFAGCSDFEYKQRDECFIKVGNRTLTVADFHKAFEIAKNAYPHNKIQRTDVIREARIRLIQQMTEEMILLERAEELGITITDSQVEKALSDIKKDYPNNIFQETLLEYAIPYQSWREGLKIRLLLEKVITQDLGDKIEITHDDILKYYEAHFNGDNTSPDVKDVSKDINDTIIKILRKEKMEKAYALWIKKLKSRYAVEINKKALEKMIGL